MKANLKRAGEILLGIAGSIAFVGLVTIAVKICWTFVEFIWGIW